MDDGTIGGTVEQLIEDFDKMVTEGFKPGSRRYCLQVARLSLTIVVSWRSFSQFCLTLNM